MVRQRAWCPVFTTSSGHRGCATALSGALPVKGCSQGGPRMDVQVA